MAVRGDGRDARGELAAAVERLEFAGRDVRIDRRHRALEEILGAVRRGVEVRLRKPVVGVALVGAHDRIGERQLVGSHEPADMIGMHVRDVDLVHLFRLVARRLEIVDEVAERGAEEIAGPGIDQYQLGPGVDEERVDRRLDRIGQERRA